MSPDARSAWFRTLGQLALVLVAGLCVGLLLGHPWPALTLAALGVVAWHYWKLRNVLLRLTARKRLAPSSGVGVWSAGLSRIHSTTFAIVSRDSSSAIVLSARLSKAASTMRVPMATMLPSA